MNRLVPFAGLLTVLFLSALYTSCGSALPEEQATAAASVETPASQPALLKKQDLVLMTVSNGERSLTTTVSGRVIPRNTTQLFAEVQGRIEPTKRAFKAGVDFNEGDILIKIEETEFALSLESQRSAFLNVLTGMLPDLKSDYPDSYQQWLAYTSNYESGASLQPLPTPKSTEEKFFLTTNQVYSLFFQIKSLEERLTKYQIIAPYSGTITAANIDIGSLVSPRQPLGTIANRINYELEAGIPLKVASSLKIGDQVTFTSNEVDGKWTGRVVRINNLVDPSTQNIPVYFSLQGNGLRSGMYLEGKIASSSLGQVSLIPTTALSRDESVLLLQNNVITRKTVQPVEFLTDSVVIKGLNNNDLVILNQFELPVEGSKIEL